MHRLRLVNETAAEARVPEVARNRDGAATRGADKIHYRATPDPLIADRADTPPPCPAQSTSRKAGSQVSTAQPCTEDARVRRRSPARDRDAAASARTAIPAVAAAVLLICPQVEVFSAPAIRRGQARRAA